jgi:hypothetical protein
MEGHWLERLNADPTPWLLEPETPAVRHMALRWLLDRPVDDPEVVEAQAAAMRRDPVAATLAAQDPGGWWVKPGGGYAPKYTGTVWSLLFLDQLGADRRDPRIQAACEYVLSHTQTASGGFGASGRREGSPSDSSALHCLSGNLLRALIGFGRLDDPRVGAAIAWEAAAISGEGGVRYYRSGTSGPGFGCVANGHLPCAWGAIKALLGLARIPVERRTPAVGRAIEVGVDFLFSVDPATAAYPAGWSNRAPSRNWFKPGFPSGYVADISQELELLAELGHARDPRLRGAIDWLLSLQDRRGRWPNRYAYNGKTWVDFERQGAPSKWVTLRACRILKAAAQTKSETSESEAQSRKCVAPQTGSMPSMNPSLLKPKTSMVMPHGIILTPISTASSRSSSMEATP